MQWIVKQTRARMCVRLPSRRRSFARAVFPFSIALLVFGRRCRISISVAALLFFFRRFRLDVCCVRAAPNSIPPANNIYCTYGVWRFRIEIDGAEDASEGGGQPRAEHMFAGAD